MIVTTGQKTTAQLCEQARRIAPRLRANYVERKNISIDSLKHIYRTEIVVVLTKEKIVAHTPDGELFFHLNMAQLRLKALDRGEKDHMIEAMQLRQGMSLLDCTLGLATDAIIAAYAVGAAGLVQGIEVAPLTALIVEHGLKFFLTEQERLASALARIDVACMNYAAYLKAAPANSFDIVYFDPMFRRPMEKSLHLAPLRQFANHEPLSVEIVDEALRVARRRVVMKEANGSREFARLGFEKIVGGKYSNIQYGVIQVRE